MIVTRIGLLIIVALALDASLVRASVPASCPYHFGSDMPAATFCVYRGVAFGRGGEVCATDVVVIWSSLAAPAAVGVEHTEQDSAAKREVYLGFVADPDLVVRALGDVRQGDRAEMVAYTLGGAETPQRLAGLVTLRAEHLGSAHVLSMSFSEPRRFRPESCAFASYSGDFLGVIRPPSETITAGNVGDDRP